MSQTSDRDIISGYLSGSREATLTILGWIAEVLNFNGWGDRIDRGDVRQESCLALLRNLREGAYEGTGHGLRAYVQSICKKQCLRALRRSYSRVEIDIDVCELTDQNPGPAEDFEARERQALFRRVFSSLKPECRRLLVWKFVRDYSHAEMAERLGIAEVTARVRLHRCLKMAIELSQRMSDL